MKKVTFFTRNILDGIEYADNFKFHEEDNYFKNIPPCGQSFDKCRIICMECDEYENCEVKYG